MINGLYNLSVLGLENQELLKKIGFDFTLLALAAQKSNDLDANNVKSIVEKKRARRNL